MLATVGARLGRAARWELRECGSLTCDLWRSRHHWLWWWIAAKLSWEADTVAASIIAFAATSVGIVLVLAYLAGGLTALLVWSAAGYAAVAAITAVPRARHHVKRDIRLGAYAITHGIVDKRPNADQRPRWQPRPRRVRFERWTRRFVSCDLPLAKAWRQGNDEARMRLIDEVKSRLKPHGRPYGATFTLEWDEDDPQPHVRRVTRIPNHVDAGHWVPPSNKLLLGVTGGDADHAVEVDKVSFAPWDRRVNPHMYFAGETGNGKTAGLRWLIRAAYDAAKVNNRKLLIYGIDGKQGGNFAFLNGREGVIDLADEPAEWVTTATMVYDLMMERYTALREWRYDPIVRDEDGKITSGTKEDPRPTWGSDVLFVVDEFVDIRADAEFGDRMTDLVGKIARLGREARVTLVLSALRPDTKEALPGLIRSQITARLLLGNVRDHVTGAMMFEGQWRDAYAISDPSDEDIAGRGVARLGGHIYRVQMPWIPEPAENPAAADEWLPPKVDGDLDAVRQRRRTRAGVPVAVSDPRERRRAAETLEKS